MITRNKLSFINNLTRKIASEYLEALDCPTSVGLYLCLKYHDDQSACSHSIEPSHYLDVDDFANSYLASSLLSKFRTGTPEHSSLRSEQAVDKFWRCEDHLHSITPRFNSVVFSSNITDEPARSIFYTAREKVHQILGRLSDSFSIDSCNFGPGSSSSVPRRKAHPSIKYLARDVTASCRPFVEWFFNDMGLEAPDNLVQRESSRITVVPKNFKADRVIAIEPDWNIFFQKGLGASIRKRLKRFGLDLDTAAADHSVLARLGSLDNSLATIDLSSASDSISSSLIRFLLPDDWFYMLNSTRTTSIDIDGVSRPITKFSSMGNGFTFELESLVFYALALACKNYDGAVGKVSVFGDDIILPKDCVPSLISVLTTSGFKVNLEKSFWSGNFRESCGCHYFLGRDVKPFFLRDNIVHDFEKFKTCNSIRRTAFRITGRRYDGTPFVLPYSTCKRSIRRVFYIPEGYGDGGLISNFDECSPSTVRHGRAKGAKKGSPDIIKRSHCIEGYKVRCLLPVASVSNSDSVGMLIHKLRYYESNSIKVTSSLLEDKTYIPTFTRGNDQVMILSSQRDPEQGNSFMVASQRLSYRIGFVNVPLWCDPEVH